MTALPSRQRSKVQVCILGFASLFSTGLPAQSPAELDRLLFEAYPIPEPGDPVPMLPPRLQRLPVEAVNVSPLLAQEEADYTDLQQQQQEVETLALQEGVNTAALVRPLLDLGRAQQGLSRHEAALENFERALFLDRMHFGFDDVTQIPVLEAMIDSHLALDEADRARQRQAMLSRLLRRNPDMDYAAMGQLLEKTGDWHKQKFERAWLPGGMDDGVLFRLASDPDPQTRAFSNLFMARQDYLGSMQWYRRQYGEHHPALSRLATKYIETLLLGAHRRSIREDRDFFLEVRVPRLGSRVRQYPVTSQHPVYRQGQAAWQRMYARQVEGGVSTLQELADTLLYQGDWELLFRKPKKAAERYFAAYEFLQGQEVPEAVIEAYLSPTVPVRLPAFALLPHSREKLGIPLGRDVRYEGYIDVSFRLSAGGGISDFRILDASENARKPIRKRLLRLLRSHPHRPRIEQGRPVDTDELSLRYYFARAEPPNEQ